MGFESASSTDTNYGIEYHPEKTVYVIKKDGSKEAFNVQKVINAVGKSAYRALTKFTEEEEEVLKYSPCMITNVYKKIMET